MPKYRVKVAESRTVSVLVEADSYEDATNLIYSPAWDYGFETWVGDDCEDWYVVGIEEVK
jgi:hypothetical protein